MFSRVGCSVLSTVKQKLMLEEKATEGQSPAVHQPVFTACRRESFWTSAWHLSNDKCLHGKRLFPCMHLSCNAKGVKLVAAMQVPSLQSQVAELSQVAQFLPSQTPNPKLPTPENNAALGAPIHRNITLL